MWTLLFSQIWNQEIVTKANEMWRKGGKLQRYTSPNNNNFQILGMKENVENNMNELLILVHFV